MAPSPAPARGSAGGAMRGRLIQRDRVAQRLLGEGLAQVVVHAGGQAGFAVALQRVGGDGDDGQLRARPRCCSWRRISWWRQNRP
jgi:ketosteroid isomerase-like protein